ncbi:bifunctional DNA primase/polymerase [Gryllotalpicola reticulitermitis]|uniref:Bifunctional DNA primase/polymerase n=1 Tax=Gryllotalpicola reticulitermitis TaxID=1184153 RepID=A0ABV8QDE3_9MICO
MGGSSSDLVGAALGYAASGQPVFPVAPGRKFPLTERGFLDASLELDQVRRWWSAWPRANIGLPTGVIFDVVDVDHKAETSGFDTMLRLQRAGLLEGWTQLVATPSGGAHIYFPADPNRPQQSWQDAAHAIDFRGAGGYVLGIPSQVVQPNGGRRGYDLVGVAPGAAMPVDATAIRAVLRPPSATRETSWRRPADETVTRRLERWLAQRGVGERNASLFWASCRLAEHGLAPEHARATLGEIARQIGLEDREIEATIASAYRTVPRPSAGGAPGPPAAGAGPAEAGPPLSR